MFPLWSFQGAHGRPAALHEKNRPGGGLSKLNSVCHVEVDVDSRRARSSDGNCTPSQAEAWHGKHPINEPSSLPEYKSSGIPRKEVIQPQLPLRLPCYDFTPITDPAFDGSLPCGLGHRLRALPAFVV